jgi:hypothetical protein
MLEDMAKKLPVSCLLMPHNSSTGTLTLAGLKTLSWHEWAGGC